MRELSIAPSIRQSVCAAALAICGAACASPGIPPGGPEDKAAPMVVRIVPDSGRTRVTPREVLFEFDEVVSERPAGAPSLDALFLISPRDGTPNVGWHRGAVSVRPRRAWKPNTVYTVTMLPGMTDLRGNVRNTGAVTIFSTGSDIPKSRVSGTVFNLLTGTTAPRALIEARTPRDTSTVYVTAADSAGAFIFPTLAPGQYRVRAILDENNNKGIDPREPWDTVLVNLTDSSRVELYAFAHDSVGARLMSVGLRDSVTLELLFDHPIDPSQTITPAAISIKTSDSTVIPVVSLTRPGIPVDTSAREKVHSSRPIPSTSLLAKIGAPIRQKTILHIRTLDIRGLDHVGFTSDRVITIAPPPPVAAPAVTRPPAAPPTRAPATTPQRPLPPAPPPPPPPSAPSRAKNQ